MIQFNGNTTYIKITIKKPLMITILCHRKDQQIDYILIGDIILLY